MGLSEIRRNMLKSVAEIAACVCTSMMLVTSHASANLYEWPPGVNADFKVCGASSEDPRQLDACQALGLLQCDNRVTGNAFLIRTKGSAEIIVSSSHTFINVDQREFYRECRFLPGGQQPGIQIEKAVLLNSSFNNSTRYWDIAAAQLTLNVEQVGPRIPLLSVDRDRLPAVVSDPSIDFSFISRDLWDNVAVISGYDCSPVPKRLGHLQFGITTRFNHNCPVVGGYSGSPGMIFNLSEDRYAAICVQESSLLSEGRQPFDPARNPNTCAVITPEFVNLTERLARGEEVAPPAGGIVINYQTRNSN